ncbi:MAG: efflux RND transporter periplasmic adaptor subunit [Clostridia bacterium]|jgi:multidrug efflux pump subunit AcrA (membrane-fusion protein)|nr:efflux RND transporter periplasmic adaptor subunit [Clostridia bacterium]
MLWLPIGLICASVVFSGCGSKQAGAGAKGQMPGAKQQSSATAVETCNAEKKLIQDTATFTGTINPYDTVNVISTQTSEKVTSVNFDVGDKVKAGDVLFTLDTTDIQNNIDVLKANIASADANIKSAQTSLEQVKGSSSKSQIETYKNSISTAKRNLESAKSDLETSKSDYDSAQSLFKLGGVSQYDLNNDKIKYENAQRSVDAAQQTLDDANYQYNLYVNETLKENTEKAQDSLNSAVASKNSTAAQMKSYEKQLSDCTVTSPISGTVLERNATVGSVLGSSTPFVIVNLDTVKVKVNVAEDMINKIKVGDTVKIKVASYSDKEFEGHISTIAPGADDGTYPVEIDIPNSDGLLKSGMFAQVTFAKESGGSNIVIDRDALLTTTDGNYVFIVEDGKAKKVDVTTGIDNGDEIQILSGLNEGDEVVYSGNTYLNDGDSVNVVTGVSDSNSDSTSADKNADSSAKPKSSSKDLKTQSDNESKSDTMQKTAPESSKGE